jgi:hypothetical protein
MMHAAGQKPTPGQDELGGSFHCLMTPTDAARVLNR